MALINDKSDLEIMNGIKEGQNWATEALYKLNRESFFNYVRMNSGSEDEAKDVLQDSVIIIYQKIIQDKLILTSSLSTYLMSICRNLWFKKLREKGKMPIVGIEEFEFEEEDGIESNPQIEQLMRLLPTIDIQCQEILNQRYWFKKRFEEIAEVLNKSIASLKMKSSRCIEFLYQQLNRKKP